MTRWAEAMRTAADYSIGTVIVFAHFVIAGLATRRREKPQLPAWS
jgi:hypothetical protein